MITQITEEEYLHFRTVLADVSRLCFKMWRKAHPVAVLQSDFDWPNTRETHKFLIWQHACAAFEEFRDVDPQELHDACVNYATSNRNPDPSSDYKNHTLNDE